MFGVRAGAETYKLSDFNVSETCISIIQKHELRHITLSDFDKNDVHSITQKQEARLEVQLVTLENSLYGFLFNIHGKSIIHCFDYFNEPEDIFVEDDIGYSMFLLEEFPLTRIIIHSKINCGTSCFYSTVDEVEVPLGDFMPSGIRTIKSRPYDFPNKWFLSYLPQETLKEIGYYDR